MDYNLFFWSTITSKKDVSALAALIASRPDLLAEIEKQVNIQADSRVEAETNKAQLVTAEAALKVDITNLTAAKTDKTVKPAALKKLLKIKTIRSNRISCRFNSGK